MQTIVSSYVQIENPDNKYAQEVFCKLPSDSLRSAVISASRTLKLKKQKLMLLLSEFQISKI